MTTLLTIYLAGMPCALAIALWVLFGAGPDEDVADTWTGVAATVVFVLAWPVFAGLAVRDYFWR